MSSTSTMTSTSISPFGSTSRIYSTTLSPALPPPYAGPSAQSSADLNANHMNGNPAPSSSTAVPTLRSMYPRAARSLLQKDFALTHSLIESAFAIITPPKTATVDELDTHRRKWDILRITLETTVYATPPKLSDPNALPPALRSSMMLTAPSLVASMHARSVRLYTPTPTLAGEPSGSQSNHNYATKPRLEFLPAQILVTLALSALKLSCPEVARGMIEDWLAQRQRRREELQYTSVDEDVLEMDKEGYEKVLDLYCLHVLPRLHDWEYARDFLAYESELEPTFRQTLQAYLEALRKREIENARTIPTPPAVAPSATSSSSTPARTPSPSPSNSSGSSVDTNDTHSTRTVVPRTSRATQEVNGINSLTPAFLTGDSKHTNGHANGYAASEAEGSVTSVGSVSTVSGPRTRTRQLGSEDTSHAVSTRTPNILTLLKLYLRPYLTTSNLVFAALFVLVPLLSFFLRLRRRRTKLPSTGGATPARISTPAAGPVSGTVHPVQGRISAEEVRRRLRAAEGGGNILSTAWKEVYRAVADAVRMAGSGLV